jgi:hypothetical protein
MTSLDSQELQKTNNPPPLNLNTLAIALKFKSAFKSPYAQLPRISSEVFKQVYIYIYLYEYIYGYIYICIHI